LETGQDERSGPYSEGMKFFWCSFSSCYDNLQILENSHLCGTDGDRTIFCISAHKGKNISMFSVFQAEREVLLMPGYFVVKGVVYLGHGLTLIDLEEVSPPFEIFGFPITSKQMLNEKDEEIERLNKRKEELEQVLKGRGPIERLEKENTFFEDVGPTQSLGSILPITKANDPKLPSSISECLQKVFKEEWETVQSKYCDIDEYFSGLFQQSLGRKFPDLDEIELCAIYTYTNNFGEGYNIFNLLNKNLVSQDRGESLKDWEYFIYYLFNGIRKLPKLKYENDLYRGVNVDLLQQKDKYKEGNTITMYSFFSTSKKLSIATQDE